MSTNTVALRDDATRDMTITAPVDPTGGRLVAWAEGLAAAHRIGSALCQTAFAPTHFRGKPDEAAAAILYGDEIGFTPTQALQNIFVISGKPAMYARAMVALVQSKGHDVWTEEATSAKVVVCGRRRSSQHVERVEWTVEKARRAGYTSNKKYEQTPEDMLYARAASTVCRRIAADALAGLAYSVEELEMDTPATTRTVTRGSSGEGGKVQRRKAPEAPEPEVTGPVLVSGDDAQGELPESEKAEAGPPRAAIEAMFAGFAAAGFDSDARTTEGKQARLGYMTAVLGREITTTKELTVEDVEQVTDALAADAAEQVQS